MPARSKASFMRRLYSRPMVHCLPGGVRMRARTTMALSAKRSTPSISSGAAIIGAKSGSARISASTWRSTSIASARSVE